MAEPAGAVPGGGVDARLDAVLRDHMGFSNFSLTMARAWLSRTGGMGGDGADELPVLRAWLLQLLNGKPRPPGVSNWQRLCPEVLPGLRSRPVWESADSPLLSWISELEAQWEAVRDEAFALRGAGVAAEFQPYRAPAWAGTAPSSGGSPLGALPVAPGESPGRASSAAVAADATAGTAPADAASPGAPVGTSGAHTEAHEGGSWSVCYLDLHGAVDTSAALERCPATARLLAAVPRAYGHAMFSALAPGTDVSPHTGPTSKKLRVHLPLFVPARAAGGDPPCCLRVADRVEPQEEGRALVFDDSFEHEAWNRHETQPRLVLILDIWHPDLTEAEVKFLKFAQKSQTRRAKAVSVTMGGAVGGADDFLSVLSSARADAVAAASVFPEAD